ncbi:MAG: hypothetical protein H6818_12775 [Phycisphaerales bacterium]|nr:hypothetical protein [Phycisphaerales bacterium]
MLSATSTYWTIAIAAFIIGAGGLAADRRLPNPLGLTLFCMGLTFAGAVWAMDSIRGDKLRLDDISVALGVAAFGWTLVGVFSSDATALGAKVRPAAFASALVAGVGAVGILGFTMGAAVWLRVLEPDAASTTLNVEGLIAFAPLFAAIVLAISSRLNSALPTALLLVAALAAVWTSLMIPAVVWGADIPATMRFPLQPGWWTWTFNLQAWLCAIIVGGAIIQDRIFRRRRATAWPDQLDVLLEPYSRWPGYIHVEATLAALVLILGVFQIIRPAFPGWHLPIATCICGVMTGIACLYMTHRRWSGNTAMLGLTLLSLAYAAAACAIASLLPDDSAAVEYAKRIPITLNATLFGLCLAVAHWLWLARFWDQQLLDGRAWTTAGRMIAFAQSSAMYLAALSVIIAFQMAIWPERAQYPDADDGLYRIVFGILALLLFVRLTTKAARKLDSNVFASTAVALAVALVIFTIVRLPHNRGRGWLIQYAPIVLAALTPPLLLWAERLEKNRSWRVFAAPIWFLSLLFIPAVAISQLLSSLRLAEAWIQPATLLALAATYAIAGLREHRRAFLVLAAVLCITAWMRP